MKYIIFILVSISLSSCYHVYESIKLKTEITNFKELKSDSTDVYYTVSKHKRKIDIMEEEPFKDFKLVKKGMVFEAGPSTIIFKIDHKNGFTEYYMLPRDSPKLRRIFLGAGLGLTALGVSTLYMEEPPAMLQFLAMGGSLTFLNALFIRDVNRSTIELNTQQQMIDKRNDAQKFISFNDIDVSSVDYKVVNHKSISKDKIYKGYLEYEFISNNKDNWDIKLVRKNVNKIFEYHKFIPEENTVLKDRRNDLYIDAVVRDVEYTVFKSNKDLFNARYTVELVLNNAYGEKKYTNVYKVNEVPLFAQTNQSITESLNFAIQQCLLKFYNEEAFQKELNEFHESKEEDDEREVYIFSDSIFAKNLNQAIDATFTIKTEKGHGSGWLISKEGYIVTNYHVVAGRNEVFVTNEITDSLIPAKVVRQSQQYDLALLKIEESISVAPLYVDHEKLPRTETVYAIGTPTSIKLGQTLSKGIISGYEKNNENEYYQLDLKVNKGNSGGPLVTQNGELVGIINAKIISDEYEGVGFAILSSQLESALGIKLSYTK